MATTVLTNQAAALSQFQTFETQLRNQMLQRKPFLEKLDRDQLKLLYTSGKDPLLNAVYQMCKDLDQFFTHLKEG